MMKAARCGRGLRVGFIVAVIVLMYPAGSLLLARLGLITTPEQQGLALDRAAPSDGRHAGQVLYEAQRRLAPERRVMLELGHAAAAEATTRLGLSRSTEWRVDVRQEAAMPAGTRLITAEEVRLECRGRAECDSAMHLFIVAVFSASGSANLSVSYVRGAGQPQNGWSQQYARSQDRWLRAE